MRSRSDVSPASARRVPRQCSSRRHWRRSPSKSGYSRQPPPPGQVQRPKVPTRMLWLQICDVFPDSCSVHRCTRPQGLASTHLDVTRAETDPKISHAGMLLGRNGLRSAQNSEPFDRNQQWPSTILVHPLDFLTAMIDPDMGLLDHRAGITSMAGITGDCAPHHNRKLWTIRHRKNGNWSGLAYMAQSLGRFRCRFRTCVESAMLPGFAEPVA